MNSKPVDVLLVEDSPEDVDLIKEALGTSDLVVNLSVVEDGKSAMDYLLQQEAFVGANRPDLIILDLNLPKKSGHDILAEIKKDLELKSIPVVVFSTSRSPEDINRAYHNHTNCYICKPLDFEGFIQAVRKIEDFWLNLVQLPVYTRKV